MVRGKWCRAQGWGGELRVTTSSLILCVKIRLLSNYYVEAQCVLVVARPCSMLSERSAGSALDGNNNTLRLPVSSFSKASQSNVTFRSSRNACANGHYSLQQHRRARQKIHGQEEVHGNLCDFRTTNKFMMSCSACLHVQFRRASTT